MMAKKRPGQNAAEKEEYLKQVSSINSKINEKLTEKFSKMPKWK